MVEHVQRARIQQEVVPAARGQPEPARREHAQHVSVREERDVTLGRARPGNHPIGPRADLLRVSPPGHPSRKISQPGACSWICLGVSPSYCP